MRADYRAWLESQQYGANTISTQCSHTARVEQSYGDLDENYAQDRLEGILDSLQYSTSDQRRGLPNPSRLTMSGDLYKGLASFRSAVGLYRRFRDETTVSDEVIVPFKPVNLSSASRGRLFAEGQERIGLERDLQRALRRELEQLEPGLNVIDDGVERAVSSGYIDITARDASGTVVVIELKAATADRAAVGQILSYMGDLTDEEATPVRGILVAHDFDKKAMAAAKMVPSLALRSYAVRFTFIDAMTKGGES